LSFTEQKSPAVKCQFLNLAQCVMQHQDGQPEAEGKEADTEKVLAMYKYVLKVATLDENLIVKQKARILTHLLDNQETIKLSLEVEEKAAQEADGLQAKAACDDSLLWSGQQSDRVKLLTCG